MIHSLVGTHKDTRKKAQVFFDTLGAPSSYVYSESIDSLLSLVDAVSLFGDPVVVVCERLSEVASSKEVITELLPKMKESSNVFIVDEPFCDSYFFARLQKVSETIADAREEKIKDVSVFGLCDAFILRNKKEAWVRFMDVRKRESGEAIAGALWWKFEGVWKRTLEGKATGFTKEECERVGLLLVESQVLAHRGEKDIMVELEKIVLTV